MWASVSDLRDGDGRVSARSDSDGIMRKVNSDQVATAPRTDTGRLRKTAPCK